MLREILSSSKNDKLRLIEFVVVLAGLLGIVVSLSPLDIPFLANFPIKQFFVAYFVGFIVFSLVIYNEILAGRDVDLGVIHGWRAYFSISLTIPFTISILNATSTKSGPLTVPLFLIINFALFSVTYYLFTRRMIDILK